MYRPNRWKPKGTVAKAKKIAITIATIIGFIVIAGMIKAKLVHNDSE